jgi:hypothetical protein
VDSRYAVYWERANGERVSIENLAHVELEAALHLLEREVSSDPIADALRGAISQELMRRQARIIGLPLPPRPSPDQDDLERRAA